MSYYTYFTVPKDYRDNRDEKTIKRVMKFRETSLKRSKNELHAAMIDAYYSKSYKEAAELIDTIWSRIIYDMIDIENFDTALWARELENGTAAYNNANCNYICAVQDDLQRDQNVLDSLYGELLCLSRIKFKDDSEYSDVPHTEEDYLLYEYQNKINDLIDNAQDLIEEMSKYKIWLDCWDSKETDDDRYNKEHQEDIKDDNNKTDTMQIQDEVNINCPIETRELTLENGKISVKTNI